MEGQVVSSLNILIILNLDGFGAWSSGSNRGVMPLQYRGQNPPISHVETRNLSDLESPERRKRVNEDT